MEIAVSRNQMGRLIDFGQVDLSLQVRIENFAFLWPFAVSAVLETLITKHILSDRMDCFEDATY